MTVTSISDFKKLLKRIPNERYKNVWFIPIRQNHKRPDTPKGATLKLNTAYRLSVKDAIQRIKSGKNVGIYGLPGGIMFLDVDTENGKLKAGREILDQIPDTFQIKSRNGGLQYYFLNNGEYDNQLFKIQIGTKMVSGKEEPVFFEIGELRTDWQYVVSPGSYVEPDENSLGDGTYRIMQDAQILEFRNIKTGEKDKDGNDIYFFKKREEKKDEKLKTFKKEAVKGDEYTTEQHEQNKKKWGKTAVLLSKEQKDILLWQVKNKFIQQKNNGDI